MRRALRGLVHALFIVAGWVLFAWGWHRVLVRGADFTELRWLVLGAFVVVPVVTVSWILHNQGIHRRKGARRRVTAAELHYRVDFHGREVVADFAALAQAQCVQLVIDGSHKRYLGENEPAAANAQEAAHGAAKANGANEANEANGASGAEAVPCATGRDVAAPAGQAARANPAVATQSMPAALAAHESAAAPLAAPAPASGAAPAREAAIDAAPRHDGGRA